MDYFAKIPLKYVNCNLEESFDAPSCLYSVYFIIADRRDRYDQAAFSIGNILDLYKVKCTPRKPKLFKDIVKSLLFLQSEGLIRIEQDLDKARYDTFIRVQITPEFEVCSYFVKFSKSELENILDMDSTINKDILIHSYLYVKSHIYKRFSGAEDISSKPEAFFKSIRSSALGIGVSKNTFHSCLKALCSGDNALLISGTQVSCKEEQAYFAPRAIVLNKKGWEDELRAATVMLKTE